MSTDKFISSALDIAEFEEVNDSPEVVNTSDDYTFARENIRSILEKGNEALEQMLTIANLSQHPRSYEVVSELIKSLASTNKDLLDLAEKNKRIEMIGENNHQTINNNLYISTAELQKLLTKK